MPDSANASFTIAIDAMGGDHGPESAIPGTAFIRRQHPGAKFLLFGDESRINPVLEGHKGLKAVSQVIHTDKMVKNDEKPSAALRASKDTSMRLAIEAVRDGQADAIVSSGNTGALMAMAKMVLKTVPGIHRPAIASVFPSAQGDTIILDLGANVLVDAENLAQFAGSGRCFCQGAQGRSDTDRRPAQCRF